MYIEDDELRDIYKTVTPERLQKLEDALMHLEKQPDDQAKLYQFALTLLQMKLANTRRMTSDV